MQTVENFLSDAGYSDSQIKEGIAYAEKVGYANADELGQLALSRILLTDRQLAGGELVGWEPIE